jgi:hypothetical protein
VPQERGWDGRAGITEQKCYNLPHHGRPHPRAPPRHVDALCSGVGSVILARVCSSADSESPTFHFHFFHLSSLSGPSRVVGGIPLRLSEGLRSATMSSQRLKLRFAWSVVLTASAVCVAGSPTTSPTGSPTTSSPSTGTTGGLASDGLGALIPTVLPTVMSPLLALESLPAWPHTTTLPGADGWNDAPPVSAAYTAAALPNALTFVVDCQASKGSTNTTASERCPAIHPHPSLDPLELDRAPLPVGVAVHDDRSTPTNPRCSVCHTASPTVARATSICRRRFV